MNRVKRNRIKTDSFKDEELIPHIIIYCCPVKVLRGGGWLKAIPNPTKADLLVARGQRPKGAPPRVGRQSDPRAVSAKAIVEGNTLAKRTCIA